MTATNEFSSAFSTAFDPPNADPTVGGCEAWPVAWPCDVTNVDEDRQQQAVELAVGLLWSMTAGRLGVCTYTEQYRPRCAGGCVVPVNEGYGTWSNRMLAAANCCRILLDHRPVVEVVEVVEDQAVLEVDRYTTDNGWLRKRGGCWSCSGVCDDPPVTVTYTAGIPLPAGTDLIVGTVACEFLAALDGRACKLPGRAVSVTRQGVTVDLGSADDFVRTGRLGLPVVDAWLEAVGAGAPRARSKVYSPDVARAIRR